MTLKSLLTLILFTISLQIVNTQEIPRDSLEKMPLDTLVAKLKNISLSDSLKYSRLADVYLKKSLQTGDSTQMSRGYFFYAKKLKLEIRLKYADTIISLSKNSKHELYPTAGYMLKAYSYFDLGFKEKALDNYLIALEYAEIKNNTFYILDAKERIANLKSSSGDYKGALSIYKDVYNSMLKEPNFIEQNKYDYFYLFHSLIIEYINVKKYDSASIYINKAFKEKGYDPSESFGNVIYHDYVYLSGLTNYYQKNYAKAIDSLKKAMPKISDHDKAFSYFLLSNIYKSQKKEDLFLTHAVLAESLAVKTNNDSREFRELYENLIEHYQSNNNTKKELKYLNGLIKFDSITNEKSLLKAEIIKRYDTPYLLNQKQKIINQLNTKTRRDKGVKIGLISTILILLISGGYYYSKQRRYLKKYKALLANTALSSTSTPTPLPETNKTELSSAILERIQEGLIQFENNNDFLEPKLSLAKLAEQLNTNSNYLSKAVKLLKHTSFSNYLHTLRINHIVKRLKNEHTLRQYTIKAIAFEAGYSNTQSFSTAFYKQTGIYPSYFLNKLNKGERV